MVGTNYRFRSSYLSTNITRTTCRVQSQKKSSGTTYRGNTAAGTKNQSACLEYQRFVQSVDNRMFQLSGTLNSAIMAIDFDRDFDRDFNT
jgi:hypothetical protein